MADLVKVAINPFHLLQRDTRRDPGIIERRKVDSYLRKEISLVWVHSRRVYSRVVLLLLLLIRLSGLKRCRSRYVQQYQTKTDEEQAHQKHSCDEAREPRPMGRRPADSSQLRSRLKLNHTGCSEKHRNPACPPSTWEIPVSQRHATLRYKSSSICEALADEHIPFDRLPLRPP